MELKQNRYLWPMRSSIPCGVYQGSAIRLRKAVAACKIPVKEYISTVGLVQYEREKLQSTPVTETSVTNDATVATKRARDSNVRGAVSCQTVEGIRTIAIDPRARV